MASKQTIVSQTKEVATTSKSSKKRKEITDTQSICNNIARSINMCKDVVFGKSLPTVKGRVIGGDPKNVLDSLIAEEIYLANIIDLLEDSTTFKDLDLANILGTTIVDEFEEVFPKFSLDYQPKGIGIMTIEKRYYAFVNCNEFVLSFENLPTLTDATALLINQHSKRTALVLSSTKAFNDPTNLLTSLMLLFSILQFTAEDVLSCLRDNIPITEILDNNRPFDIIDEEPEEDEPTKEEPNEEVKLPDPALVNKLLPALNPNPFDYDSNPNEPEYDVPVYQLPAKVTNTTVDKKEEEETSDYEMITKVLFDLVDSILPDFRLSHVALVTIIVTQLASLIILYRNLKIRMIGFKSLVTMQIVGLLSTVYVFLIHGHYIPEDHDISLGRIRFLLSNYFNPPKEYYNLTDNPETLVLHSPTAAQLVQVRTSDLEFYKKFKDSQLTSFLVPYPSRLLTYLELAEVKEKARSCTQQVKLDDASVLLDKFLGPIGFVFALLSCHPKSIFGPALKNLFSVVDNAKKYSKSLNEIKEQLMNFFLPQESYVTKIIQQREENLKAIQPSLAHLAIDHKAYQRLLRAKQESAALFKGIMHQNGKNEMFRLFTQSVSAVDVKIFEFQKLVEHSVGRQEPVGIHFYGDVGIGKTTFITRQLCGILANRLGLNPNTYNVKINPDGFYGVYGAEAFAYMDEVGDSSDSGPEFALINTLMSSISQHIPSAFVKEQPFLSKFLLLISNYNLQEVSGTIRKKARTATAFRSRFIEIHVTNPAVKSNSSRGNDPSCFSNENFRFSMTRYNLDDTSTTTDITLNQLVDLMVEEYEKKHQAFKEHLKRFPEIQAGPRGSPMSIGIVGPQGTGKTQLAHELLEDFNGLGTETVIIEKRTDFPKTFKPASVVLLNDLITVETLKNEQDMQCLHQLENLGSNGVVINTSNVVPKQLPWYYFFTNWTLFKMLCMASYVKKRFTLPIIYKQLFSQEGLYRRTGYTGTFWHNNSVLVVNGASVLTIKSCEGFEFVFDNISYTASNAKNAIYERIQSHRGMKQHHFRNTNMEERVGSDWNIFIWAENMQTFIERWASFNLSQLGIEVRMNSIAIKQSALSNTNVNPDVLLNKRFTAENFISEIYSLIAYLTTTNIHLKINIRIGENYFWNEGLSIYTNYEIPTFEVKNDFNGFSADGIDFSLQELKDFYIENIPNPSLRKQILLTKLHKSMIVPCVIQERLQRHIEERGTVITISKTQALYNAMKTEFSHSPIFYIATFLFFLLSSTLLIKFLIPNKKTRKTRQQAVTYNKGFGRSKATGHRYMTLNGKIIYSDDEANFNEARYQDYGENDSDSDIYQQGASEERLERTVIIPEKQFVNYHNILSKNTPRKNIKLVLPEGTNYKGVRLTVRNTAAMHESFEVTGREVWTCDYLSDLLTLDNNVNAMGFNNIEHMMSVIDPQKRYVYVTITKTPTLSVIGLSAADIDLLKQCKEQYICSIIQQPLAFNKICNINTGEIIPCSFEEINFEPKTFVGIKKYRLKKKFYRIINFPKQQMLSTPVRVPDDLDLLSKTLKNNAVTVTSDLGRVGGFYVEEGFVLTVRHIMSSNLAIEEENRKTLEVERVYYPDNEADYMLLRVKGSTGHPSLLNRFNFLENAVRTECKLVSFSYESDICASLSSTATDQPILNGTISLYKANTILIGPSSSIPTKAGDCGRPYVTTNKYLRPSIIGIHVAASAHDLFASKVDPTWLKTICRASQQALLRYDVPGFTGNLQLVGKNQRTINSPSKPYSFPSKLSKYMSDMVPSMKRPAKTSIEECTPEEIAKLAVDANGVPDFYLGQILQYNDPIKDLPEHTCKAYVSGFTARYHQEMVRNRVGNVLRSEEILNGIMVPNDPLYGFANGMNWNGAIGYEAQTKYQHCHTMSDIVEHTSEGAVFNSSPCAQFVQSKIDRHLQASWEGLKIDDILQDNLKQENRENEKAYKQRVFTSFPKSLSALVRFFLLRFSAMLTKHHGDMPFKIGVNSNAEWHFEMMKDISFGGSNAKGFGFDLSRCDKHMGAFFFVDVLLPIFSYPVTHAHKTNTCNCNHSLEEHLSAIKVVVEHLYNNLIASQDMLYRKTRGNSSGSDLTILINSIYVDFMVYAWFRNTARRFRVFPPTYTAYEEIIRRMLCGDDGKILVALCGQKLLTFESFKNFCAHYGVLVDTPEKDGSTEGLRPVLDIPFISRKWVLSPHGFYLAKFKIEIISGLCYWTRYDTTEQYDEALRTLSAFICPYGEEMYTKFYNAALLYQGDYLSHYVVPTYKEALFDLERQIPGLAVLQYQSKKNSSFENNLKMYSNNSEVKDRFYPHHERNSVFLTANGLKRLEHHVERDGIYTTSILRPVSVPDKDVDWRRNVRDVFEQYAEISSEFAEKYGQTYKYDCHNTRSELELNSLIVEFAHKLTNDWQSVPNDSDHLLLHNNHAYFIAKAQFALALLSLAEEARELFPDRYYSESYLDWLVNIIFPLPIDFFTNLPKVQMERNTTEMNQTPMHQTQPSMSNMASVNTVAIGDAMTMTVPHLPQLATVVAPPAIPVLENMPIDNTIDMRNPQQTRTIGLPSDLIAYGGVLETIEDVAKGSYQIVNTYTINVNQQAGTEIFRIPYGLDLLGGYNLAWTNLHQRYTGPILVKFTIISNAIVQGRIRIGWDIDPAVKNNSNSSKYGAADFDLSQSSNVVVMELNPVAEATGRNFFRVGETPVGQPYLYGVLITPLTNNFSDLGNIQILVESRLAPGFIVADPIDVTPITGTRTLVSNSTSIDYLFKDLDVTQTTVYLESRKYPKFPNYPANVYASNVELKATDPVFQLESDLRPGDYPTVKVDNTHHFTDTANCAISGPPRGKSLRNTKLTAHLTGTVYNAVLDDLNLASYGNVDLTGDALLSYNVNLDESSIPHIVHGTAITIDTAKFPARSNGATTNNSLAYTTGATDVITGEQHDVALDSKLLPIGYAVCEFADVTTPSVRASAVAPGNNIIPRNTFGWILHNYCYQSCPSDGQIKISIVDKVFQENLIEVLYRPEIGFYTKAPQEKFYTFFNANIGNYKISAAVVSSQSALSLNVDLGNFVSFVQPAQQQMFQLAGNLGRGLEDGLFGLSSIDRKGYQDRQNIYAQGSQTRQNMAYQQQLNNFGSNLYHSPMNGATSIMSHPNARQGASFATVQPNRQGNYISNLSPTTMGCQTPQIHNPQGNMRQNVMPGSPGVIISHTGTLMGNQK